MGVKRKRVASRAASKVTETPSGRNRAAPVKSTVVSSTSRVKLSRTPPKSRLA